MEEEWVLYFEFPASKSPGLAYQCSMEFILAKLVCIHPFILKAMFTLPF